MQSLMIYILYSIIAGDTSGNSKLYETLVEKTCPPQRIGRSGFMISTDIEALLINIPVETGRLKNIYLKNMSNI